MAGLAARSHRHARVVVLLLGFACDVAGDLHDVASHPSGEGCLQLLLPVRVHPAEVKVELECGFIQLNAEELNAELRDRELIIIAQIPDDRCRDVHDVVDALLGDLSERLPKIGIHAEGVVGFDH